MNDHLEDTLITAVLHPNHPFVFNTDSNKFKQVEFSRLKICEEFILRGNGTERCWRWGVKLGEGDSRPK